MTDITELAQSLKRRATSANEFGESLYVKADDVLSLVEALEKAQRYIEELREWNAGLAQESFERQQRIAELESQRKLAFTACNRWADKFREAEKRIAELESRTVKLPKPISVLHRLEFTEAHRAIYAYPEAEVNAALDDAGIEWEAE